MPYSGSNTRSAGTVAAKVSRSGNEQDVSTAKVDPEGIKKEQSKMDQQDFNQLVKDVVDVHAEAIEDLKNFQRRLEEDKNVALLMQLNEKQMVSSATYTNLILVAGYAGFFGFWSTLSPRLPLWLYSLCGLLALLSLMLFVSWEVVKMIWSGFHIAKTNSMIKTIGGGKVLQLFEASQLQYQIRSQRVWWAFLLPTLVCGLAAGFLLVGFFCYQLWQAFQ